MDELWVNQTLSGGKAMMILHKNCVQMQQRDLTYLLEKSNADSNQMFFQQL